MSHHEDCRPHVVDFLEDFHNVPRRFRVQVPRRFIGNEQQRPVDDGPGDGYALLFAAAEVLRQGIGLADQADQVEDIADTAADEAPRRFDDFHGKGHVFLSRLIGQEAEILEDDAHFTAQIGHAVLGQLIDFNAVDEDRTPRWQFFIGQELDERRLAGTAGADDEDELALADMERYVVQGNGAIVIDLGYVL